ncbi:hypothetical protein [Sphingopyxis sp. H115]|uniref:hypothetical protein n=1 Tax=Sphingopyxis sp. H115 TaxID=1759073 RepID=UPI0007367929|nr:hypothetical protein [Sphingopyxis sp. H115]KTE05104.1 hypothetical protein ATE71_18940 [Sphingopyxis sp. H115]
MDYDGKIIWYSFQRLSRGDQSCLAQMLAEPGGQQLTASKSAHSEFYHVLHSFGMAEPGTIDEGLSALGMEAWVLTEHGHQAIRVYLAQGFAKADIVAGEGKSVRGIALRFLSGYAPVQLAGGLLAYFLTRAGFDISGTATFNLALLTILSCHAGVRCALPARRPTGGLALIQRLEQLRYIDQRRGLYAYGIVIAAFAFHLPVAIAHDVMLGGLTQMALVRALFSAAIAGLWAYFALPHQLERVFRKTRKGAGLPDHAEEEEEAEPLPL